MFIPLSDLISISSIKEEFVVDRVCEGNDNLSLSVFICTSVTVGVSCFGVLMM